MVTQMTNRLLATVMTFAVSTGLATHAAQNPHHALPQVNLTRLTLPRASSVPQAVQTAAAQLTVAANHVSETATAAVDPTAAIRAAFQRDHVALEHLRQQASVLKGSAHPAFNQLISNDEETLVELEKTALASNSSSPSASIATMDHLVAAAEAALAQAKAQPAALKTNGNGHQHLK
ncbi:MAG TPA: hypothetical protein VLS53_00610 [Candidatus Dormibacteraeota bacterium]|nr:hypothetical protein [Candidatus Dormibacteraeota bacterium]